MIWEEIALESIKCSILITKNHFFINIISYTNTINKYFDTSSYNIPVNTGSLVSKRKIDQKIFDLAFFESNKDKNLLHLLEYLVTGPSGFESNDIFFEAITQVRKLKITELKELFPGFEQELSNFFLFQTSGTLAQIFQKNSITLKDKGSNSKQLETVLFDCLISKLAHIDLSPIFNNGENILDAFISAKYEVIKHETLEFNNLETAA
ncbi:MAG: hypothetical protein S4CHLAM7_08860 [Chlamydiae bacterium]|nr:hypothetical protein [Chlamydiota bacterium]